MHIFHCSAPCTPLHRQREVAAKPSPPRHLALPHNKPRRRRRAPLVPLPWAIGASFRFSNNAGDTRIRASLPMGACSGHYCSSRSCHQLSVWPSNDIDTSLEQTQSLDVKYGLLQNAAARAQFSRRVACAPEDLCKCPAQCPWARLPFSRTFPQRCRAIMTAAFLLSSLSYLRSTVDLYAVCLILASPFHFRCSGRWHDTSDCLDRTPPSQRASCSVR